MYIINKYYDYIYIQRHAEHAGNNAGSRKCCLAWFITAKLPILTLIALHEEVIAGRQI